MLIEFRFSNYRSFREEALFSMLPVRAYKEYPDNITPITIKSVDSDGVLNAAAIYGPNASGKSNLLKSLSFAKAFVLTGNYGNNPQDAFRSFVGNEEPSHFSFVIYRDEVRYDYEFTLSKHSVVKETLYSYPIGKRLVFQRWFDEKKNSYLIKEGPSYKGLIEKRLEGFTDNKLVINLIAKYGINDCSAIVDWFAQDLIIIDQAQQAMDYGSVLQKMRNLDENGFAKVIHSIGNADLGIKDAQLSVSPLSEEEQKTQQQAVQNLAAIFKIITGSSETPEAELSNGEKLTFQFKHSIDGNQVGFGFENESFGTITMLNLAMDIFDALSKGSTLVIDELDRSLHSFLLRKLIALFFDPAVNKNGAQIIFTTHDLSLMNAKLLRRDQIWFVEKNAKSGASDLYSLAAFSPKKGDSILNKYLYGLYGAIPFLDNGLIDG